MKRIISALILSSLSVLVYSQSVKPNDSVNGRILVMPQAGLKDQDFFKILKQHGGKARKISRNNLHVVSVANGTEADIISKLKKNPHIKFAEYDRRVKISFTPNDPYLGTQYHLNTIGAFNAWDISQGLGVTIAILDSGVNPVADLANNMVPGYNIYDNNADTRDVCGHGTAVAGVPGAITNNGIGVAGVSGQAKIMPIRISYFDTNLNNCYGYYSTITSGITYAADHGARIANISYGGIANSQSILSAAQYMKDKGGLVFVAAGNSGAQDDTAPTNSVIVVSATNSSDRLAGFSSYGNYVTLAAPGEAIYTTSRDGQYQGWSGTSLASPLAAGVGALIMSANPALNAYQVESILKTTAQQLGDPGRNIYYGYGRVNADAAVRAAINPQTNLDTIPPTVSITSPGNNANVSGSVPISIDARDNVGVTKVDLLANGQTVASDTTMPFGFSWDSTTLNNGMVTLMAIAYDAAGNQGNSSAISVNVYNAPVQWQQIAVEGQSFNANGLVRYGAGQNWITKAFQGSGQCSNSEFGSDPAYGIVKSCQVQTVVDAWQQIAVEGQAFSAIGTVRYGVDTRWISKDFVRGGQCTNIEFGSDPAYGILKSCELKTSVTPPAPLPWRQIAVEGQSFSINGTVRYGTDTRWITKQFSGQGDCSNSEFGSDPAYGVVKRCESQ